MSDPDGPGHDHLITTRVVAYNDHMAEPTDVASVTTWCDGTPKGRGAHTRDVVAELRSAADTLESVVARHDPRAGDVWTRRDLEPHPSVTVLRLDPLPRDTDRAEDAYLRRAAGGAWLWSPFSAHSPADDGPRHPNFVSAVRHLRRRHKLVIHAVDPTRSEGT